MRIRAYLSLLCAPPMPVLITVSLVAWLALLSSGHSMQASGHHSSSHTSVHVLVKLGWSWFLMLAAMMTPLLSEPIHHLWVRSLPRRRLQAILFFVLTYTVIWMLVGLVLSVAALQLKTLSGNSWLIGLGIVLLIVLLWQASPWRQFCLNYCHWKPRLAPFGLSATWDCLRFGMVKGFWCVGSCWALMFLPLVFVHAEFPLMLVVGLILVVEQYLPARVARWQIPFSQKKLGYPALRSGDF